MLTCSFSQLPSNQICVVSYFFLGLSKTNILIISHNMQDKFPNTEGYLELFGKSSNAASIEMNRNLTNTVVLSRYYRPL